MLEQFVRVQIDAGSSRAITELERYPLGPKTPRGTFSLIIRGQMSGVREYRHLQVKLVQLY